MNVTVVTATYGEDNVQAQAEQDVSVRWVCVTDHLNPACGTPWEQIYEPRPHLTPRMAAHVVKCRPDHYSGTDLTVWLDASAQLQHSESLRVLTDPMGDGCVLALVHPDRTSIADEAKAAAGQGRYALQALEDQAEYYLTCGYEDEALYATTLVATLARPTVFEFGDAWLLEQVRWTCQDQISFPYVAWKMDVRIRECKESLWTTPHIVLRQRTRDV